MTSLHRFLCRLSKVCKVNQPQSSFTFARSLHASAITDVPWRLGILDERAKCTLIPGDGVGPELADSVKAVFEAAKVPVDFDTYNLSEIDPGKSATVEEVAKSIVENGVCLKGVVVNPHLNVKGELQTLNSKLRETLDLFANVVHVKSLEGIKSRHEDIDCIVIREQTEGEYSALEYESVPGVVECMKIVTERKSKRIAKFAFDFAIKHDREKITAVHKANIMKLGDGLFLQSCQKIAKFYPKIQFESLIVDNCTMQAVSNPHQFDVMVTPNLYGNIIDNLLSGLVGGAGVVSGASFSADCAVFEPGAKHSYIEAAGKDVANPTAMLLCGVNMLYHIHLKDYAAMIHAAVEKVVEEGKYTTADIGGNSSTKEFTSAVIENLDP